MVRPKNASCSSILRRNRRDWPAGAATRHFGSDLGALLLVLLIALTFGCEPKVVISSWVCPETDESSLLGDAGIDASSADEPIATSWSTGFEEGFCDYSTRNGFCYARGASRYEIVSEPTHTGRFAAAFSVVADTVSKSTQARCVRQGTLPAAAYYGAWYYVPAVAKNRDLWNLMHFQGGDPSADSDGMHGLWDVSLVNNDSGGLRLTVYDFLRRRVPDLTQAPNIPIGKWFHIEIYLKRATDESGQFVLYQDNEEILRFTDLITDDTTFGQWYVGNLAFDLEPADFTLYVDDVSISSTRSL